MTQGSFSCKQSVIYGRRVNSCKQKPTWSSRAATGPFLGRSLACLRFSFHSCQKYFARQLAPSSFGSAVPQGQRSHLSSSGLGAVRLRLRQVFFVNTRWPRLLSLSQPNERGRYSSSEALPSAHPSVGRFAFFPSTGVKARGKCHFTWLICHTVTTQPE